MDEEGAKLGLKFLNVGGEEDCCGERENGGAEEG